MHYGAEEILLGTLFRETKGAITQEGKNLFFFCK